MILTSGTTGTPGIFLEDKNWDTVITAVNVLRIGEEWYTWDHSPRPNVRVLARVDEATYSPASDVKMGDHPVIWTNERVKARNVYIFMGHGPDLLESETFTTILRNAVLWAAGK